MSFDFNKTLSLIKGGLFDHKATWDRYLGENPGWQHTAINLTGPLLGASVILGLIFSRLVGGYSYLGIYGNFLTALVMGLVTAAIGFAIAVLAFNFLAGVFKGKPDFSRAFAAVSLAAVPAWVAGAVSGLIPWLGFLLAFAGAILSLVFLYRIIPLALGVPDDKRIAHFVASLIAILLLNLIVGRVLGTGTVDSEFAERSFSERAANSSTGGSGLIGEMERQGRLMEAAAADKFEPPEDGKLSNRQVRDFAEVFGKVRALQEEYAEDLKKLSEEMDAKADAGERPSLSDMTKAYSGVGSMLGVNNAEMEIVKSGDGNWAEHNWVKQQLRTAKMHQGRGSAEIEHNFELLTEYEEELGEAF